MSGERYPAVAGEAGTIYVEPTDRYVVSLIVGYSEHDLEGDRGGSVLDRAVADEPDKVIAAALGALDLTRDESSAKTVWHVFDRASGQARFIEQGEFDGRS